MNSPGKLGTRAAEWGNAQAGLPQRSGHRDPARPVGVSVSVSVSAWT